MCVLHFFFFQAEDGIRDYKVTGVQTCALPILDAGQHVDQSEWRTYIQKTTSTLKYLSEETGGFAIVDTNDFAAALRRVDAETSDYYVLGFYSTNQDPTKRTRQLEVRVDRPGVTVHSRRAYSLKTEGKPPPPPPLKKK